MTADRVRDLIAQQRATEARNGPPRLHDQPRLGDVVAFIFSVTVLVYALIDTVIGVLL